MPRKPSYSAPTVSLRVPNYARDQVRHFTQLLDLGGPVEARVLMPAPDGAEQWITIVYSQDGFKIVDADQSLPGSPDQSVAGEQSDQTRPELSAPVMEVDSDLVEPALASASVNHQPDLTAFAQSLFEQWQAQANGEWGRPVPIEAVFNRSFSSMLLLSFLSHLTTLGQQGSLPNQAKLTLTTRPQDGPLLQMGNRQANGLTFVIQNRGVHAFSRIAPMEPEAGQTAEPNSTEQVLLKLKQAYNHQNSELDPGQEQPSKLKLDLSQLEQLTHRSRGKSKVGTAAPTAGSIEMA